MFKLNTYYEKEKLPTIYSPNVINKSLSQKRKINVQNIFEQTYSNSIFDLNNNNLSKLTSILKRADNKAKFNSVNNKIMTIYNKNNSINNYNINNYFNFRTKSYNNSPQIHKPFDNNNIPFNDSYNYFINSMKFKKFNMKITDSVNEISKNYNTDKLNQITIKNKYTYKITPPKIPSNQTITYDKNYTNNIKIITKKKDDSFNDRLKKFFMPNYPINKQNKFPEKNQENMNKKKCPLCHKYIDNYRFNTHYNLHPSKIFNWLYLGSYQNACNNNDLKDLKINYILNCAAECQNKNYPEIIYFKAKINDFPNFNISLFFNKTNEFINKAKLSGKNILIHCQLGISRSTTCLITYMIKYLGYNTISAMKYIKNKRPQIMPNFGFLQQLKNYEEIIKLQKNNELNEINENTNINNNKKFIKTDLRFNDFFK